MDVTTGNLICINPDLVKDDDIAACAEGEGRPEFNQHLSECRYCQAELKDYQGFFAVLQKRLNRPTPPTNRQNCPKPQLLTDYAFNLLDQVSKINVETHLTTCAFCPAELKIIQAEIGDPPIVVRTVGKILEKIVATLKPKAVPQLAFRSTGSGDALLEYQAQDVRVILQQEQDPANQKKLILSGQVSRPNFSPEEVKIQVLQADTALADDNLDAKGRFYFEDLNKQTAFRLEIVFSDFIAVIPDLPA
jgi:hypothetical protein